MTGKWKQPLGDKVVLSLIFGVYSALMFTAGLALSKVISFFTGE